MLNNSQQCLNSDLAPVQQLANNASTVDSTVEVLSVNNGFADGSLLNDEKPIVSAIEYSESEMARLLGMDRGTMIGRLKKCAGHANFKVTGKRYKEAKNAPIYYPEQAWRSILAEAEIVYPVPILEIPKTPENIENEPVEAEPVEPFSTGAMVIAPTTEVLPSDGYGLRFDLGQATEIHLHIHATNAEIYKQQSLASAQSTQNMINALLQQQAEQGVRDREEIDETVQAIKNKMVEVRTANMAVGKSTGEQSPPSA